MKKEEKAKLEHELRNPLTIIGGGLDVMEKELYEIDRRIHRVLDWVQRAKTAIGRGEKFIDSIELDGLTKNGGSGTIR